MKLEDIIEGLNRFIESKRDTPTKGHIVLRKQVNQNSAFKAYKTFVLSIYYVDGRKSYLLEEIQYTDKVLSGQEDTVAKELAILLTEKVLNMVTSDYFNLIINGTYAHS